MAIDGAAANKIVRKYLESFLIPPFKNRPTETTTFTLTNKITGREGVYCYKGTGEEVALFSVFATSFEQLSVIEIEIDGQKKVLWGPYQCKGRWKFDWDENPALFGINPLPDDKVPPNETYSDPGDETNVDMSYRWQHIKKHFAIYKSQTSAKIGLPVGVIVDRQRIIIDRMTAAIMGFQQQEIPLPNILGYKCEYSKPFALPEKFIVEFDTRQLSERDYKSLRYRMIRNIKNAIELLFQGTRFIVEQEAKRKKKKDAPISDWDIAGRIEELSLEDKNLPQPPEPSLD